MLHHLNNQNYKPILSSEFNWSTWAIPKKEDGSVDFNKTITGQPLLDFVNKQLFPYLQDFKNLAKSSSTIEYKIGEIFSEVRNRIESGFTLRNILDQVDQLSFLENEDKNELSSLYEDKIKSMGNAGKDGGQYYTPRPLIRSIVKILSPKIGETIIDPAVGSAGFLCEAYNFLRKSKELTSQELETLKTRTLYGKEKKSLPYVIGIMNMILHDIETPNLIRSNTLSEKISDIEDKDRVDIVLANPPFGGGEQDHIKSNFPIVTGETAYLFLQHFIKVLKKGGRAGVVIKNSFLSNDDQASKSLRSQLLQECNLHTILDLPKVFGTTGVMTVVLFFNKGEPTKKIWYYQLNLDRNVGKNNPLNNNDLKEFIDMSKTQEESKNSWMVNIEDINNDTWDLTPNNPNRVEEVDNRTPVEIMAEIEELDAQAAQALKTIKELL